MSLRGSSRMDLANSSQDLESNGVHGSSSNGGTTTGAQLVQGTKRGLFMALTVGVVLLVLVISAAVLVSRSDNTKTSEGLIDTKNETVKLEDVLDGKFGSVGMNGTWISDSELQYFTREGSLAIYHADTKIEEIFIHVDVFTGHFNGRRPFQCVFSADRKFVMVGHNYRKIYRHSFHADYDIYDVETKSWDAIVPPDVNSQTQIQLTQWSPVDNAYAFVHDNNIFFKSQAKGGFQLQITTDGSPIFFNGVTDWVYEEEMFGSYSALWFSPDGKKIAYASFDDRNVSSMEYSFYGEPGVNQYPIILKIPYPKAGLSNPVAKMTICVLPNGENENSVFIDGPPIEHEHYIGTVFWLTSLELGVITLNRNQNESKTYSCNAIATNCREILAQDQTNGWIDVTTPLVSLNGQEFITLSSQPQTPNNLHYHHILKVDVNNTANNKPITSGNYAVDQILGWDLTKNKIYYIATRNNGVGITGDPRESHLYSISDEGASPGTPECITCLLTNIEGQYCTNNNIQMSKNFSFFTHTCTGPNPTEVQIRTNTKESDYAKIMTWAANEDLRNRIQSIALPKILHYDIPLKNGFTGKAKLLVPQDFDKTKEYPILVDVYAGPGSQKITNRFLIDWGTSLTTDKHVIYAYIDGRGSGRQSDNLLFSINRKLGTVEIEDQIDGLRWLLANTEAKDEIKIDKTKTAIWGWSYGGYATAMVMGTDTDQIYKCGISVAPVTNWDLYDTIYTERYMGTPWKEDNQQGYNYSAVANHIENFRNKQYLLVHGNADDNVHYQQSMVLSRALERADILFRQQSYPDEDHGIPTMRRHLYHTMEKFLFEDCFK